MEADYHLELSLQNSSKGSLRLQPMLGSLIHATQTGFVKEHSILDNIFTFWEAILLSRLQETPLAILLLDFKKAYDRVDWSFLEDDMTRWDPKRCGFVGYLRLIDWLISRFFLRLTKESGSPSHEL